MAKEQRHNIWNTQRNHEAISKYSGAVLRMWEARGQL